MLLLHSRASRGVFPGAFSWGLRDHGTQMAGTTQYDKPILTVTLRQV